MATSRMWPAHYNKYRNDFTMTLLKYNCIGNDEYYEKERALELIYALCAAWEIKVTVPQFVKLKSDFDYYHDAIREFLLAQEDGYEVDLNVDDVMIDWQDTLDKSNNVSINWTWARIGEKIEEEACELASMDGEDAFELDGDYIVELMKEMADACEAKGLPRPDCFYVGARNIDWRGRSGYMTVDMDDGEEVMRKLMGNHQVAYLELYLDSTAQLVDDFGNLLMKGDLMEGINFSMPHHDATTCGEILPAWRRDSEDDVILEEDMPLAIRLGEVLRDVHEKYIVPGTALREETTWYSNDIFESYRASDCYIDQRGGSGIIQEQLATLTQWVERTEIPAWTCAIVLELNHEAAADAFAANPDSYERFIAAFVAAVECAAEEFDEQV